MTSKLPPSKNDLLIPVAREEVNQEENKATLVAVQELVKSIPALPEQAITTTIPLAEQENTPPPSPSEKELITIGNDDAPPLVLTGESHDQDPVEQTGDIANNCCCSVL
jgi:hypothetical protein